VAALGLAAALAAPARPAAAGPGPQGAGPDGQVESFEAAGVQVLLKRVQTNQVVAAQLFIKGGTANLTPETAGIENLLLQASQRGTRMYAKDAFNARLAATGTTLAGTAGYDYSVLALQTVRDSWDEAWGLFAEALLHPTLAPAEVELVRGQLVNAVRQRRDNPDAYVFDLSDSLFYQGHPYALNPVGTEQGLAGIGVEQLREWHDRRLTKDNLLLVVVGNVSQQDVAAKVAMTLGPLPATGDTGRSVANPEPGAPAVSVTERALPTTYVRGYFPAPTLSDEEDYPALTVALNILSTRFFEEVRTKRNLSYAVFAGLSSRLANYGLLYVTAVEPDSAVAVMLDEVRKLKETPVASDALEQAVNVFVTRYYMGLETNADQATQLGRYELLGGGWEEADDFVDEVRKVTPEDVQRVMRRYVSGIRFAVLGDPSKVDRALFTSM
jgi:zinc protease